MTETDDLLECVQRIAVELRSAVRTETSDPSLAGWGQFVDARSPVFQIGPYGTSAGLLANQIASPGTQIEKRIKARLLSFWDERPHGKLFPQNVRLAFVVLALAKTSDPELVGLRGAITAELLGRQLPDGSWSDAATHATAPAGGRPDATAWSILALARANRSEPAAQKGAQYLASFVAGSGSLHILSPIAVAAALYAHPNPSSIGDLRRKGFYILEHGPISKEESISFFDYEMQNEEGSVPARDYLCFPAFYPTSVLINALARSANFGEKLKLNSYRSEAVARLIELTNGHPYKLPGARFASTVDQAMYALSYEQLQEAEAARNASASWAAPLYKSAQRSVTVRLVIPLFVLVCAVVTGYKASSVPEFARYFVGSAADPAVRFAEENASVLQFLTATLLAFLPGLPKSGIALAKRKLFG